MLIYAAQQVAVGVQHSVPRARILPHANREGSKPGPVLDHHLDGVGKEVFALETAPRLHQFAYGFEEPPRFLEIIEAHQGQVALWLLWLLDHLGYVAVRPIDRYPEARRVGHLGHEHRAVSVGQVLQHRQVGLEEGVHEEGEEVARDVLLG